MSPIEPLKTDEVTFANDRFIKTRKAAKVGMALMASFMLPFLGTIAFVALYPPFWNPKLATSVVSMGLLGTAALVLLLIIAWRPVRRMEADLAAGQVQERVSEVATMEHRGPLVRLTLSDEPRRTLLLEASAVDAQTRSQLRAGALVRVRQLPKSGCLLSLAVETPTAATAS